VERLSNIDRVAWLLLGAVAGFFAHKYMAEWSAKIGSKE
jgi:hypothetical protein